MSFYGTDNILLVLKVRKSLFTAVLIIGLSSSELRTLIGQSVEHIPSLGITGISHPFPAACSLSGGAPLHVSMEDLCQSASMCPKHDTPCVLPQARGYTSWSASLTHWTADLWPLISPESQSDPRAHSLTPAGSLGSQLTQQYCVMLSYESLHISAPPLLSGNQCQIKWLLQLYVWMYMPICLLLTVLLLYNQTMLTYIFTAYVWLFAEMHYNCCPQSPYQLRT